MSNVFTVAAYESAGSVSFDENFLREMADGKLPVQKVQLKVDTWSYDALLKANARTCQVDYYKQLLENGEQLEAYKYLEATDKSISMESYGIQFEMGDDE